MSAKDLQSFTYLNDVLPLLQRLHSCGTNSDKAGNRLFFADHYVALLLLYFFNPVLTSRNALLQASRLAKVQTFCGGKLFIAKIEPTTIEVPPLFSWITRATLEALPGVATIPGVLWNKPIEKEKGQSTPGKEIHDGNDIHR